MNRFRVRLAGPRVHHRATVAYFQTLYRRWMSIFPGMTDLRDRQKYRHRFYRQSLEYLRRR